MAEDRAGPMTGPGWDYEEVYAAVDGSAIWRNGIRFVPAAEPADQTTPDTAGRGWHYLLHLTNGDVVKCPGNQDVAQQHLKKLREQHVARHVERFGRNPDTVPYLIGVYPPNAIGGPGSTTRAFGFSPTLYGDIHTDPEDWIPA